MARKLKDTFPRLGELLIRRGIAEPDQIEEALALQRAQISERKPITKLGHILVVRNELSASVIREILEEQKIGRGEKRVLTIGLRERDEVAILALAGRLDETKQENVTRIFERMMNRGFNQIAVDCRRLVYLNSQGVSSFVAYVDEARARRTAIAGVFDLEMIGYTSPMQTAPPGVPAPPVGNFIGVVGNRRSERLVSLFKEGASRFVPSLPVEGLIVEGNGEDLPVVRLSDHAPFWDAGYPAVMITDTAFLRNPHYHLSTDTIDTLDFPFLRQVAAATAVAAALLAGPA